MYYSYYDLRFSALVKDVYRFDIIDAIAQV